MRHKLVDSIPVACITTRTQTTATAQIAPLTVDVVANTIKAAAATGSDATVVATDTQNAAPLGAAHITPSGTAELLRNAPDSELLNQIWAQATVEAGLEARGRLADMTRDMTPRNPATRTADFYIGLAALDPQTPLRMFDTTPPEFALDLTFGPGTILDAHGLPFTLERPVTLSLDAKALIQGRLSESTLTAPIRQNGRIARVMATEMLDMSATELLRCSLMMTHLEAQELEQVIDDIPREMCFEASRPTRPQLAFLIDRDMRARIPTLAGHLPDRDFTYVVVSNVDGRLRRTIIGRADYEVTFRKMR